MSRRHRTRRRLALLVGVTVLLAAWLGFRAVLIRSHLDVVRSELSALTAHGVGVDDALRSSQRVTSEVDAARASAHDPVWRLAAAVPYLGRSFAVVSGVTDVTSGLVHEALPPLRTALEQERAHPFVRGGQVDLPRLASLQPLVTRAAARARTALAEARSLPSTDLPAVLQDQRRTFLDQVQRLSHGLDTADTALGLAPGMLGRDEPRRYFLAVQNNAETRATGGLIGAYAVFRADKGKIVRETVGTDQDFRSAKAPVVDLGPDFASHYDIDAARTFWSSAVLTPDWPSAGAILAGLWTAQSGQKIDGTIGIDPLVMAELLRATGPVTVGRRTIGADNVVDFVMRDEYAEFDGRDALRKDALRQLAARLFDKVIRGASGPALVNAAAAAGRSGHLQIWSSHPAEQSVLAVQRVGGALPGRPGAFLEVVTQNGSGNKADYYVRRKLTYTRPERGTARVELMLTDLVDPKKVPRYVTLRLDAPPKRPGETKLLLSFFGSVGAAVREVTVDGVAVPITTGKEKGHGWASLQVLVAPGSATKVVAMVDDPGGPLTYRQQPLVVDDELDLHVPTS